MSVGPHPRQQSNWDWRAAANFVCGGAGSGLVAFAALAASGGGSWWPVLAGAALVGAGLSAVWFEIGRPWRALNVFFNPRTSWMTREAVVGSLLFVAVAAGLVAAAAGAAGSGRAGIGAMARLAGPVGWPVWPAAVLAIAFVWCQGRILRAARGIPTWREPRVVPLVVATGLAEGGGLFLAWEALAGTAPRWAVAAFAAALLARFALWHAWRSRLRAASGALAAVDAVDAVDAAGRRFRATTLLALVAIAAAAALPVEGVAAAALQAGAGLLAVAGGAWFKFTLVTRAAFNQGFSLPHLPVRGVPRG